MPDYKEMYLHLFRETTKAINALQQAQQATEEMFIEGEVDFESSDTDVEEATR